MSPMFTDKHVLAALIIAPILAVLSWLGIGQWLGEQPQLAKPDVSYPLVARSNCRYHSGRCDLENHDFALSLTVVDEHTLSIVSKHPLRGIFVSVSKAGAEASPSPMKALSEDHKHWQLELPRRFQSDDAIRLVAATQRTSYYGETATQFLGQEDTID